jgi:hypothetical protein
VDVWVVIHLKGSRRFTLHVILILSIHDLLTYGLLYGQMTKGASRESPILNES